MSVKAAEYLKRTCLICGCHTNQTINIYEPRSGPNIVHLIQAKFKFQPLNDDKYLCFSCNNWLINWHSLQAMNSNEPESPSGTFRSHMNMVMQEKPADQLAQCTNKTPIKPIKPVARVSPRLQQKVNERTTTTTSTTTTRAEGIDLRNVEIERTSSNEAINETTTTSTTTTMRTTNRIIDREPLFLLSKKLSRNLKIYRTLCTICKRRIVCITQTKSINIVKSCKKCLKAQNVQNVAKIMLPKSKKLVKINHNNVNNLNQQTTTTTTTRESKVQEESHRNNCTSEIETETKTDEIFYRNQKRWQPILDGKVVSKLRQLGTTLARDAIDGKRKILSEAKQKPQWERQLDDDEILLDFNTTISEVLPIEQRKQPLKTTKTTTTTSEETAIVDLTDEEQSTSYQISLTAIKNLREKAVLQEFDHQQLPKGLSISLVSY